MPSIIKWLLGYRAQPDDNEKTRGLLTSFPHDPFANETRAQERWRKTKERHKARAIGLLGFLAASAIGAFISEYVQHVMDW